MFAEVTATLIIVAVVRLNGAQRHVVPMERPPDLIQGSILNSIFGTPLSTSESPSTSTPPSSLRPLPTTSWPDYLPPFLRFYKENKVEDSARSSSLSTSSPSSLSPVSSTLPSVSSSPPFPPAGPPHPPPISPPPIFAPPPSPPQAPPPISPPPIFAPLPPLPSFPPPPRLPTPPSPTATPSPPVLPTVPFSLPFGAPPAFPPSSQPAFPPPPFLPPPQFPQQFPAHFNLNHSTTTPKPIAIDPEALMGVVSLFLTLNLLRIRQNALSSVP
ncbi:unnamed protein product [Nippostrongylus brasiliensis]|uniref:Vegetative cell wall protein gp1-like n=1 Tax=Nippostrongylus brasiliensis TaxID=27835 RepID=A0A0N4YGB9_NIPBR|nr:unnamed protein product [Nippostrongylus brasiliensis]